MLFYPVGRQAAPRPGPSSRRRGRGSVAYLKEQTEPEYTEGVTNFVEYGDKQGREAMDDELLEEAIRMVLETGQASVSMLQRKFRVGYTRAARLIDMMEEMKIVGPNIGSKAREILMTTDQVNNLYFHKD
jgi:S-DNA-T family DNA segregation ATPase FtsK/SpoIIIE